MKHLVCLFAIIFPASCCLAQFDFEQDSLDGWIQAPPDRWKIASEEAIEGMGSLHHAFDNPASGTDLIGTNLANPDLEDTLSFSFRIRHGYAPSSSNNWQFFCLKDYPEGFKESAASGIVFGVNYTGYDDHLKIWQLGDANTDLICDTGLDYEEVFGTGSAPLFKLTRFPAGKWTVEYSAGGETGSLVTAGSGQEQGECHGKFMGFRYAYSSSQDRKLWIDAIQVRGRFYRDTLPPVVTGLHLPSPRQLEIIFSEPVASFDPAGFQWNIQVPDSVRHFGNSLQLFFPVDFPNRVPQQIRVSGVTDGERNLMKDTLVTFMQDLAEYGDVIINELMTDPEPVVYLPPCEYIELFNRHDSPVDISAWKIHINNREYVLDQGVLDPGAFLLLTHYGCVAAFRDLTVQGIISVSAALANSGGVIALEDRLGRPVHRVMYGAMERYHMDGSEGGWSLERADPGFLCGGMENWVVSDDPRGGTPGRSNGANVQYTDKEPPFPVALGIKDDSVLKVSFNETLYLAEERSGDFMLNGSRLTLASGVYPLVDHVVYLHTQEGLRDKREYDLAISSISDCRENVLEEFHVRFKKPEAPQVGHPQLSEVMYDPVPGGNEYIELHNHGNDFLDLRDLAIRVSGQETEEAERILISDDSRLIFPGGFVVLTRTDYALREEWNLEDDIAVLGMPHWRTLADRGGCISLINRSGQIIDHLCYHDSLHHDMLANTTGVSLERMNAGICEPPSGCWTSAATSAGYGTPGSRNSRDIDEPPPGIEFSVHPPVFSPDNDGTADFLQIRTGEQPPDGVFDLFITDLNGNPVCTIVNSGTGGSPETFAWDGTDQEGKIVRPGLYVVHMRISGKRGIQLRRAACAVVYK